MSDQDNPPADIILKVCNDDKQLAAIVPGGGNVIALTAQGLNDRLTEQGYGDWQILESALAEAAASIGKLSQEREFIVANRTDGELSLEVSADATEAVLSITPHRGGKPVTKSQVMEALAAENITHGIQNSVIETAISSASADPYIIAKATLPTNGDDAIFESLIPEAKDSRPKINQDGSADYHEIGSFIVVNAGDRLMRKLPPTSGKNGVDVYGKELTAQAGKNLDFAPNLAGVQIDPDDKDILIAATGGQPTIVERGATVSPVITVKNVDLTTGNIDFDGAVNIQGDVVEGMKIFATGDIAISGMVEGAELNAGGNIVINKGVIGRGDLRTAKGEPGPSVAQLKSGESIEARFIENAIVEAAENVTVGELVSHSEISALNHVVVGKKGAKKGHILGGKTQATMCVQAQIIGSQANVKTVIEVGSNPELHKRVKQIQTDLQSKEDEKLKLMTLVSRLSLQKDPKSKALLERVIATQDQLKTDIQTLQDESNNLGAQDELSNSAKVKVGKHAFSGSLITVCDKQYNVQDRTEAGEFLLVDGDVKFEFR